VTSDVGTVTTGRLGCATRCVAISFLGSGRSGSAVALLARVHGGIRCTHAMQCTTMMVLLKGVYKGVTT
jgi:hypothetical protein